MFTVGQQVTVTDGGWTGTIERIESTSRSAYVRFPGRPDSLPYALEALHHAPTGAPMYDTLTLDDLYARHSELHHESAALHRKFMALPSKWSAEALAIQNECGEISKTMDAVYTEINRRIAEAHADA